MTRGIGIGLLTAMALGTSAAGAQDAPPVTHAKAEGNAVSGGLAFTPAALTARVGGVVAWTNTDTFAPHTVTEDHGLWRLGGDYGATPLNGPGFAPGATVQRAFEAGTAHFFCEVHPTQMRGTIAVPVSLGLEGPATNRSVVATWASSAPAAKEGFDVQVKRGGGDWTTLKDGTQDTQARVPAGSKGTVVTVRARLRSLTSAAQAEDFSPDASVTSDQVLAPKAKPKPKRKRKKRR